MTLEARHLIDLLRGHYLPPSRYPAGVLLPEIEDPDRRRRADLLWIDCTERAPAVVGHEIKVTRSDLQSELADGTKTDGWMRHCTHWWLVVAHPDLISGLDLPDTWGVMSPPSGRRRRSMTVLRPAPQLRPRAEVAAVVRVAARMRNDQHGQQAHLDRACREAANLRAQIQELLTQRDLGGRKPHGYDLVMQILRGVTGSDVRSLGGWNRELSVEDVVAALRDLGDVQARRLRAEQELASVEQRLRGMQMSITRVLGENSDETRRTA